MMIYHILLAELIAIVLILAYVAITDCWSK